MYLYRRNLARATEIERVRSHLLRDRFPRLQMFILVALTGIAGFLASYLMLLGGVDGMALRYVLAIGVAYAVFMLLLWIWLRTNADDYADLAGAFSGGGGDGGGVGTSSAGETPSGAPPEFHGGGGTFDGGGASADVDFSSQALADDGAIAESAIKGPLDAVASADEAAIPLAVLLLAAGILLSSLFVVWTAPLLFAEIMVDGALATGLYRRLRHLEPRNWLHTALRRTILPFVMTTLVIGAAGLGMQAYAPNARSIGEVLAQPASDSRR